MRKILRGLSLTSVLFVFQACYGTPRVEPEIYDTEDAQETVQEAQTQEEASQTDAPGAVSGGAADGTL